VSDHETPAHALWACLRPRGPVFCADPGVGPGRLQDCVTVGGLALGRLVRPDGARHDGRSDCGLWGLAATDHALHRLCQRDPAADIDETMWAAHAAALAMLLPAAGATVFLPAGNGGFVATFEATRDRDTGGTPMFHCQCHTWLHTLQLSEVEAAQAAASRSGAPLGDNLLLPMPLRHLWATA
jgi:hypothetical protein